jgi:hypothetical protein
MDDVLPYNFPANWFNSRAYFDCLAEVVAGDVTRAEQLYRLILASIHYYLSVETESLAHAESAHSFDPDFPLYRLHLAELLSQSTEAAQLQRARNLSTPLADSSFVAQKAFYLINAINERLSEAALATAIIRDRMPAASRSLIVHGDDVAPLVSSSVDLTRMHSGIPFYWTIHKTPHGRRAPRLSVIVCGQAGYGCSAILSALAHQSAAPALFEVIYVECLNVIAPGLLQLADTVISCDQGQFFKHRGAALNVAGEFARGEVLAVVEPGAAPDTHFVARILRAFFRVPDEPVDKRTGSTRVALVSGWIGRSEATPRFIAVPKVDFDRIQRFDEHDVFAGDSAPSLELLWRLQLAGTPVFDAGATEPELITLPPWWELTPLADRPLVLLAARLIWPRLCEEGRLEPMVRFQRPKADFAGHGDQANAWSVQPQSMVGAVEIVSQHQGYNILRCGGRIIAVRQSLGPIDPNLSTEELVACYGTTDLIVRDTLDGIINAIDLVINKESLFSFQSSYVRYRVRRFKRLIGGKVRRLGFRIDDPNSLSGRLRVFVNRVLQ